MGTFKWHRSKADQSPVVINYLKKVQIMLEAYGSTCSLLCSENLLALELQHYCCSPELYNNVIILSASPLIGTLVV